MASVVVSVQMSIIVFQFYYTKRPYFPPAQKRRTAQRKCHFCLPADTVVIFTPMRPRRINCKYTCVHLSTHGSVGLKRMCWGCNVCAIHQQKPSVKSSAELSCHGADTCKTPDEKLNSPSAQYCMHCRFCFPQILPSF